MAKHPRIDLRPSPYIHSPLTVEKIMRNVVYALLPLVSFSVWQFGISALALILVTTFACLGTESLFCRLSGKANSLKDYSATIRFITGDDATAWVSVMDGRGGRFCRHCHGQNPVWRYRL